MIFWKRLNYGDSKDIIGFQRLGWREGGKGRAQKIFRAGKLFCMILQWGYMSEIQYPERTLR